MESTNKLEIKKYIKLQDGRVLESSKTSIFENTKNGILYHYVKEWNDEGTAFSLIKVIASSDYLHNYYDDSNVKLPGLDVVVHFSSIHGGGYYCTFFDFDEHTECYLDDECGYHSIEVEDGEVLLGSWYEGGMRFVAKWDREKKDWVLI